MVLFGSITFTSGFHHKKDRKHHSRHGRPEDKEETAGMVGVFEIVRFPFCRYFN